MGVIRHPKDFYSGLLFIAFGIAAIAIGSNYTLGSAARMREHLCAQSIYNGANLRANRAKPNQAHRDWGRLGGQNNFRPGLPTKRRASGWRG